MSKELEFLEEKYGHNSWKHYPPSKQQVAKWLQEFTEKQFAICGVSHQRELFLDLLRFNEEYFEKSNCEWLSEEVLDEWLKSKNCG